MFSLKSESLPFSAQKSPAVNSRGKTPTRAAFLKHWKPSRRVRPLSSALLSLMGTFAVACVAAVLTVLPAQARDLVREPVEFVITHDEFRAFVGREGSGPGFEEIHLLGDLPELGGGEILQAIEVPPTRERDANGAVVEWRVTVSLPVNRDYSYQFSVVEYKPVNPLGPDICNPVGADPVSPVFNAATSSVSLGQKTVFFHSDGADPIIHWRQGSEAFQELAMDEHSAPVAGRPGEKRWVAQFGEANREVEFFLTTAKGNRQELAPGNYRTHLNSMLVQDENLFTYIPAPQVSPTRRDFDKNDPPALWSSVMDEFRHYRVWLPRGYDDHPDRHYPTIYGHDGQWWFGDNPSSDAWNQIDPKAKTISREVAQGRMQEAIFVLVDNIWESRTQDMLPPYINDCGFQGPVVTGEGDLYREFIVNELMPYIDSHYRTLPGPENTGTVGLSFGGVAAFYHGWDFVDRKDRPLDFGRIGSFSGSFWTCGLLPKINADSRRDDIRVYFDSGVQAKDNFQSNLRLYRDRFVRSDPTYEVENDIRYKWYCGGQHVGPHWKKRLPQMMDFLFPGTEAADELPQRRNRR
jgi:predicted alpha/beta superfamily hydrolase